MDTGPAFLDSRDFGRIARAIRFIDANFRAQPRLAAIAASAHLSEFHFNRLFRRWAGVTPRQYLAYVTARARSEERRVGKECRSRRATDRVRYHLASSSLL